MGAIDSLLKRNIHSKENDEDPRKLLGIASSTPRDLALWSKVDITLRFLGFYENRQEPIQLKETSFNDSP